MIKNYPFQNGNKRIAVTVLFVFLYKNNKWLNIDNIELYNFTKRPAESPAMFKKETAAAGLVQCNIKFLINSPSPAKGCPGGKPGRGSYRKIK